MEMDPHTLQHILQRIHQQMRCPQCGKHVPVEFNSVQVVSEEVMLLQLKCEGCNAYVVLQASLQGIEQISAPPYEENATNNASSGFTLNESQIQNLRQSLRESGGSFEQLFAEQSSEEGAAGTQLA